MARAKSILMSQAQGHYRPFRTGFTSDRSHSTADGRVFAVL